jgi:hypothetical protein
MEINKNIEQNTYVENPIDEKLESLYHRIVSGLSAKSLYHRLVSGYKMMDRYWSLEGGVLNG